MSAESHRKYLKGLVRSGKWDELSRLYNFELVWISLPSGRKSIDWRCVPKNLYSILQSKAGQSWPDNLIEPSVEPAFSVSGEQAKKNLVKMSEPHIKGYDTRQLEHLGDALVNLAARFISAKEIGRPAYFLSAQNLSTNKNLASAGFVSGDAAEVQIGMSFAENGVEKAFLDAVDLIKKTQHYKAYYSNK